MAEVYNLSDVQEYFEFSLKGHVYRFRHLTFEELKTAKEKLGTEAEEYFSQFITKVNEASPDFKELSKQMIAPEWKKFKEMLTSEFAL